MKRRLRIAIEITGLLLLAATLAVYARALFRDDHLAFNWVKNEGATSRARDVRFWSCEGGYALTFESGLTLDSAGPDKTLWHESARHGSMALHVPPNHFACQSGPLNFVLGYRVRDSKYYAIDLPRWAVPAFGGLLMLLALLPRGIGWIQRRHSVRKPGFPVEAPKPHSAA